MRHWFHQLRPWTTTLPLAIALCGCGSLAGEKVVCTAPADTAEAITLGLRAEQDLHGSAHLNQAAAPPEAPSGLRQVSHLAAPPGEEAGERGERKRTGADETGERKERPEAGSRAANPSSTPAAPFTGAAVLTADALVEQVLARSPSLAEMVAAWKAAAARYPQVVSLDDPMVGLQAAPGAWFSREMDGGVRVEISQRYPWCGKRELRGENAQATAQAAAHDVADMKLQLVESARRAFYDYYLVDRALSVNRENLRLLREFRKNAESRYATGAVSQQDVLQAEVEIGRAEERQVTLERLRPVTAARINTLMHLPPDAPLPPPPEAVALAGGVPDPTALRTQALHQRPDLLGVQDRLRAEQASLALAHKEFLPDVEVMAAYDSIWQEKPLRPQVGVRMNLPVRCERRYAAVAEAEARVGQRLAEMNRLVDQANYQVEQAYQQLREGEQVVRLYEDKILPAARENVKAAQTAYVTGKVPFLSLIEAQRNVVAIRDRLYEALAEAFRRRAALERAIGGPLPPAAVPSPAPPSPADRKEPDRGGTGKKKPAD